jgi:hypothetical protein
VVSWIAKKHLKLSSRLVFSKRLMAKLLSGTSSNNNSSSRHSISHREKNSNPFSMASSIQENTIHSDLNRGKSMVLGYLEKKSLKRQFYSDLQRFNLTQEHLGSKVSHNIIGTAVWGTVCWVPSVCLKYSPITSRLQKKWCEN